MPRHSIYLYGGEPSRRRKKDDKASVSIATRRRMSRNGGRASKDHTGPEGALARLTEPSSGHGQFAEVLFSSGR
jgi:hypothetical protein